MAKKSVVFRNEKRLRLWQLKKERRDKLKSIIYDKSISIQERFAASLALDKMPKDSSPTRIRRRCPVTGRGRGCYRKFKSLSRIMLREQVALGSLPGVTKSSW